MRKRFPIEIGIKLPKVIFNGSHVIRCWFETAPQFSSSNIFSFTYDFKRGFLIAANDCTEEIKSAYLDMDGVIDYWGIQSIDNSKFIVFQGDDVRDVFGEMNDEEMDGIGNYLDNVTFEKLSEEVLNAIIA
ncbi:MAG TPA: hypothetical protein PLR88_08635 [Bacteroidales bacterium]|nr:hypothetical protein [Bacteroidales bacterium]HPT21995.1 hypothetical protein [Bacteroidales bacterium]